MRNKSLPFILITFIILFFNIHTKAFALNIKAFCVNYFALNAMPTVTFENIDGAVTPEPFIEIKGKSSEDVILNINGKKKPVKKGKFSFNYNLRFGENDIKIIIIDKNGNKENIRAVVTREIKHERNTKATILVGTTFAIILSAYVITFSGWLSKRRLTKTD